MIAVLQQQLTGDADGRKVLQGQLMNQSGQVVNISHAIATFYDKNGKVIWVSDGYVAPCLVSADAGELQFGSAGESGGRSTELPCGRQSIHDRQIVSVAAAA